MLNDEHLKKNPGDTELSARIASYELAGRLQLKAAEVSDLSRESKAVHKFYGTNDKNPNFDKYRRIAKAYRRRQRALLNQRRTAKLQLSEVRQQELSGKPTDASTLFKQQLQTEIARLNRE